MSKELYADISGMDDILSVSISSAHNAATSVATVKAKTSTIDIGDTLTIDLGYVSDFDTVFTGYVKLQELEDSEGTISISAQDELVRAVDYFITSSTPNNAFSRTNIEAEFLIRDLLALAGITNYDYDATSFTFATEGPLEVNLISSYDICKQITDILAWHLYADVNGQIHFVDRKPYIVGGDTASVSVDNTIILSASHSFDDEDLRNRVVVYGKGSVAATAQATSPFLPAGFFKSTVLATDLIDNQTNAQLAANFNLALLNRISETVTLQIEGDASIFARDIVHVEESFLGINDNYYAYAVEHSWGKDGFVTDLILVK